MAHTEDWSVADNNTDFAKTSKLLHQDVIDFLWAHSSLRDSETAVSWSCTYSILSPMSACGLHTCSFCRTISCFSFLKLYTLWLHDPESNRTDRSEDDCSAIELSCCGLRGVHGSSLSFGQGPDFAALFVLRTPFCPSVPSFRMKGPPADKCSTCSCRTRTVDP